MGTLANSEDPDEMPHLCGISSGSTLFAKKKRSDLQRKKYNNYLEIITCDPWIYTMDNPKLIVSYQKKNPFVHKRFNREQKVKKYHKLFTWHISLSENRPLVKIEKLYFCENYISYFLTKTYVVGTQKNHLNEMVLLST